MATAEDGSLALTLRRGEEVLVGPDIVLKVLQFDDRNGGMQVRVRITAPKSVRIWRREVAERLGIIPKATARTEGPRP